MEYKAIKIRLDPTPSQERQLSSHVGAARTTYNIILAHVKEELDAGRKVNMSMYGLRDWFKTVRDEQTPWWKENSSDVYAYGAQCVANGLSNYFSSRSGKRAGKKVQFPKFKSKSTARKAFSYSKGVTVKDTHGLYLPRVGRVHAFEDVQQHLGDRHIVRTVISQSSTGKWFASLTYRINDCDTVNAPSLTDKKPAVGVDWGVKTLATLSDGTQFNSDKVTYNRLMRKLRRQQQEYCRRKKGSKRREVSRKKIARTHERITCIRQDTMHKLTRMLASTYDGIVLEDLSISAMSSRGGAYKKGLNRHILNHSFYEFKRQLEYKCREEGTTLMFIDRYYPSSKTCSQCGHVKAKLSLSDRVFVCESCGFECDRDVNAAKNILVAGSRSETLNGHGARGKTVSSQEDMAQGDEVSTTRYSVLSCS